MCVCVCVHYHERTIAIITGKLEWTQRKTVFKKDYSAHDWITTCCFQYMGLFPPEFDFVFQDRSNLELF